MPQGVAARGVHYMQLTVRISTNAQLYTTVRSCFDASVSILCIKGDRKLAFICPQNFKDDRCLFIIFHSTGYS